MKIAVVIPALDEADRISGAIQSALSATSEPAVRAGANASVEAAPDGPGTDGAVSVEVIVVDGGSGDRTADRARLAGAEVISSARGRARQMEAGWRYSAATVLVFLHADSRLPPGWARALCDALADPGVAGGAFAFRFDEDEIGVRPSGLALRIVEWSARMRVLLFALPYGDQAIFTRRSVLEASGGIADVPLMEDIDLVRTLKRSGELALLPLPARTSARRYFRAGITRTVGRHALALLGLGLGVDRATLARWVRR